jgi:hypothetical protein
MRWCKGLLSIKCAAYVAAIVLGAHLYQRIFANLATRTFADASHFFKCALVLDATFLSAASVGRRFLSAASVWRRFLSHFSAFYRISSHFIAFHRISAHFIVFYRILSHFIAFYRISSHFIDVASMLHRLLSAPPYQLIWKILWPARALCDRALVFKRRSVLEGVF